MRFMTVGTTEDEINVIGRMVRVFQAAPVRTVWLCTSASLAGVSIHTKTAGDGAVIILVIRWEIIAPGSSSCGLAP